MSKRSRVNRSSNRMRMKRPSIQSKDDSMVAKGIRISLTQSILDSVILNKTFQTGTASTTENSKGRLSHDFGFSVGYAYVRKLKPGFMGKVLYSQYSSELKSLRYEASAALGLASQVYIHGGANIHQFSQVNSKTEGLNPGVGFQAGVGVQISENFGLDISFVNLNNDGVFENISTNEKFDTYFNAQGFELSLHGTF